MYFFFFLNFDGSEESRNVGIVREWGVERESGATIATDHREYRRTLAPPLLLDTENYTPRIISPGEADI